MSASLPELSNIQLDAVVHADSLLSRSSYVPSCAKDSLKCPDGCWTVVNLGDESSGGSHWCTLDRRGKVDLWIDSFGFSAPTIVRRYCMRSAKVFIHLSQDRQLLQSTSCGFYALATEKLLQMGDSLPVIQHIRFWTMENGSELGPSVNELILKNYATTWQWF